MAPAELVAFGTHPDDVELGCGATLAAFVASGGSAVIVDLTGGERASRGSAGTRWQEAQAAAAVLGVPPGCLKLPDTGLQACSARQRRAVVALLRQLRPAFLLIPHPADPHPDHREASLLLQGVAFLAAVKGFAPEVGEPHRPQLILAYPGPRQLGEPPLVVEVTASYARKLEALACYDSQFAPSAGPPTHLASGYFLPAVEGRDRAYGNLIGAERGEGFFPLSPINASALRGFLARVVCASA